MLGAVGLISLAGSNLLLHPWEPFSEPHFYTGRINCAQTLCSCCQDSIHQIQSLHQSSPTVYDASTDVFIVRPGGWLVVVALRLWNE